MKKVSLMIHQDYVEDTIKALHETGFVEIIDLIKEDPLDLEETVPAPLSPELTTSVVYETRLTRIIDILQKRKTTPGGIRAILHPQLPETLPVQDRSFNDIWSSIDRILNDIETSIIRKEEWLHELEDQKVALENEIQQISLLQDFKIDLSDFKESPQVIVKAGITSNLSAIKESVASSDYLAFQSKEIGKGKKKEWIIILIAHSSEKNTFEKIYKEHLTLFDFKNRSGSPKKVMKTLIQQQSDLENQKKEILSQLDIYTQQYLSQLSVLREELQIERFRKEVSKNFTKTDKTYLLKGWILEKHEEDVHQLINKVAKGYVVYTTETPSSNPDNPPTYLQTPRWAATFRTFLELFALPKYNELDPTIFIGIFFILFFAVMLGDAGYGLVIFLLSVFGYLKFGKYSPLIKNWSFLGLWLGISTVIMGVLTNGFFGDLIPRFFYHDPEAPLYSLTLAGIHLPLEPLRNPLTILMIALIFGIIHLNLGIVLGLIQAFRQKKYKALITQHFSWIPIQIGGGLLIGRFMFGWQIDEVLFYSAGILTIIGIILLFAHAGPIGFFGITGYIGDWLSYARLLALGLATAGMALAFNVVSEMTLIDIPIIGLIIPAILLIILHLVNLGLQALGAGVHSLRLQYVEFFNRFYEGGGREFSPFKIKRKYTRIEEKIDS